MERYLNDTDLTIFELQGLLRGARAIQTWPYVALQAGIRGKGLELNKTDKTLYYKFHG
jgi:hypothetical protein